MSHYIGIDSEPLLRPSQHSTSNFSCHKLLRRIEASQLGFLEIRSSNALRLPGAVLHAYTATLTDARLTEETAEPEASKILKERQIVSRLDRV